MVFSRIADFQKSFKNFFRTFVSFRSAKVIFSSTSRTLKRSYFDKILETI